MYMVLYFITFKKCKNSIRALQLLRFCQVESRTFVHVDNEPYVSRERYSCINL